MSTSSLPEDYSAISNDTITITLPNDTISLTDSMIGSISYDTLTSSYTYGAVVPTSTVGSGISTSSGTISINTDTFSFNSIATPIDWKDSFPNWDRVQDMCKEYPSLEIALRNFKTIYELVKDDYDNPVPKK